MSSSAAATLSFADTPAKAEPMRPVTAAPPLFAADVEGEDHLGRSASAHLLADLATNPGAGTPLLVALHGSSGSGKSSLLRQIVERVRAAAQQGTGPLVVTIDASTETNAASGLVAGLFTALKPAYPDLAEDAAHSGADPVKQSRAASDRVAELRRQLDAERQALDDLGGRQSRLVDTVLFDTPGSRVDLYARGRRGRIEGRLRAFGLGSGDPMTTYKELVRAGAESEGGGSRFGMALRALWAYKGQGTLIVLAILLFLLGWISTMLAADQESWVNWLNGLGDRFAGLSAWAQDHAVWLMPISHAAYALATLAVLVDILRAFRFIHPIMRGATLLSGELEGRRRDIDGLLAHQTSRVDALAAEVDAAVRHAEAAERRIQSRRTAGLSDPVPHPAMGETAVPQSSPAETFLASLAAGMRNPGVGKAPGRIVVAIDELDRLSPPAAAAYLDAAQRLLRRPGFVTIAAVDRQHVLDGFSDTDPAYAAACLGRCAQLSYDLDAEAIAAMNLGPVPPGSNAAEPKLDRPWQSYESQLLHELSVFAGPNPRSIKRFVNSYRVARADAKMAGASRAETAGLALALALDASGAGAELHAFEAGTAGGNPAEPQSTLDYVVATAQAAIGERFIAAEIRRGLQVARIYSRRG